MFLLSKYLTSVNIIQDKDFCAVVFYLLNSSPFFLSVDGYYYNY